MITKVEAGKTYKLINRDGWLGGYNCNKRLYHDCFENDLVHIDEVRDEHYGYNTKAGDLVSVIGLGEYKYFELVEDAPNLHTINKPFGELDNQTKKDLLCAWVDGAKIEFSFDGGYSWDYITAPSWVDEVIYRVIPPVSEKDKLIAAAQQKLKEAQEDLDKLQKL